MSEQAVPFEVLDAALECKSGVGTPIEFHDTRARERFRWRLFAAMSQDAKRSKREDDPRDTNWGRHRWAAVRIDRLGDTALWVGRYHEVTIGPAMAAPEKGND